METLSVVTKKRLGFAITAFVLGLISLMMCMVMFTMATIPVQPMALTIICVMDIVISILALIFGIISVRTTHGKGLAISGIILSSLVIALMFMLFLLGIASEFK